jgi:mannose-6-phosphate isomerase-like protein (cupin superfamily)
MPAYVVDEKSVPAAIEQGDAAETRVTFDSTNGCARLVQRVISFERGDSRPRSTEDVQELLYVVSGRGALHLNGQEHPLEPDTAALILQGETYEIEADELLKLVSVTAPAEGQLERKQVTVRFADCEEQRADENRTFRVLVEGDVTQFVGIVQPCRAPDHSHPYDEVGYILEGRGVAHVGGASTPIGPGSCFHLPPQEVHCIENTGPGVMRIMGVFYPSGSPKQRSYDEAGN